MSHDIEPNIPSTASDPRAGDAPAGDVPVGSAPAGNAPAGDAPVGNAPVGDSPFAPPSTSTTGEPTDSDGDQAGTRNPPLSGCWARLGAGLVILAVVAVVFLLGLRTFYSGRVFPRVTAGGVSLSGLDADSLDDKIRTELPGVTGPITLRDPVDGRTWRLSPYELGLATGPAELAALAIEAGRAGGPASLVAPVTFLIVGHELLPDGVVVDEQIARLRLQDLAPEVDVAPEDAELRLEGGELVSREPVLGRQLEIEGTLAALQVLANTPDSSEMDLAIVETAPRVGDASGVRLAYEKTVSGPVNVVWEDSVQEIISAEQLERWASIENTEGESGDEVPIIVFDYDAMREWVEPLVARINREPQNARFHFDPNTGNVRVASPGRSGIFLDMEGTLTRIVEAAYSDDRTTTPAVFLRRPSVSADSLGPLRLVEELVQASVGIRGIPEGRARNILLALERFDGAAVEPGTEFSFNDLLGPVTSDLGYDMAIIDVGGQTAESDAPTDLLGGIDQVAAVAFRSAFWAGLPIIERHAPATRSGWIEPPIGMDATVDGLGRDLRYINDTGGHILIQTGLDREKAALIWTIYGIPDGRLVSTIGPDVSDVKPALTTVVGIDDDRIPAGERRQAGWAREGAMAEVERTVTKNGAVLYQDRFVSDYAPAADVVVTGSAR